MLASDAAITDRANPSKQGGASRTASSLTLLLIIAAATVLRFLFLARKPFWFDECFSVAAARLDWPNFLHLLWWREANMSLYYLLLRSWLHFGSSEFFIRSLSAAAAVAAVPAIFWLGSLLYDRRVGLIAAALLSVNAFHICYAQDARSYTLFVLLAVLSSGFLVAALQKPSQRHRIGYVIFSVLAVYAHFYALLLIAAQYMAARSLRHASDLDRSKNDSSLLQIGSYRQMLRAWRWIGIAVLPLLIFVAKTGAGPIKWITRPGWRELLAYFQKLAGNGGPWFLILCGVAIAAAVFPSAAGWKTFRVRFLLIWLFFPVTLTVALSFARPVFLDRYLIFCLPAFLILVAAGMARLRTWWMASVLAGILLLSLQGTFSYYDHDFDVDRDGIGAASNFVLDHAAPADAVMFYLPSTRAGFEFYESRRSGLAPEIIFPHHAERLDYRDFTGKPTPEFLRSTLPHYARVWIVLMYSGAPGNPDPTTALLTGALGGEFSRVQVWEYPKVEVRVFSQ